MCVEYFEVLGKHLFAHGSRDLLAAQAVQRSLAEQDAGTGGATEGSVNQQLRASGVGLSQMQTEATDPMLQRFSPILCQVGAGLVDFILNARPQFGKIFGGWGV